MSPIMETLTGIMIAVLIFYSGILMSRGELDINNFFIFSGYDACISASKITIYITWFKSIISAASRILPVIDQVNYINDFKDANNLKLIMQKLFLTMLDFLMRLMRVKLLNRSILYLRVEK